MKKYLTVLFIIFFIAIHSEASQKFIINSGHTKPVNTLAVDYGHNILFSGDGNGTIKLWDLTTNTLIKNLQVSNLPVKKITINPVNSTIGVLTTDNLSTFKLSVWNWETGKKLFTNKLSELPLFIFFSPKGSYLVYGKPDWNSVIFLDAHRGFKKQILATGTGIVSSAFISPSEKTLLLYTPSGTIQYWNLVTGQSKIDPIQTKGSLSFIHIDRNGTYLSGYYDGKLYLINLVTGKVADIVPFPEIINISADTSTGDLAVLSGSSGSYSLSRFTITGTPSLNMGINQKISITPYNGGMAFTGSSVYLPTKNGSLYKSSLNSGTTLLFSRNILRPVSDLAVADNMMLIAAGDELITVQSDLFSKQKNRSIFTNFSVQIFPNKISYPTGITYSNNGTFYTYPLNNIIGPLKKFNPFGEETILTDNFQSPLVSVKNSNNIFLALEKNGRSSIIDQVTGKTLFSYTSYGIQSIAQNYKGNLIAGRNQTAHIKSPLLKININTEEVVPIRDSNILSFLVDYDTVTHTLYSLGFEKKGDYLKTVLKSHRGRSLEITKTLLTYPGEDSGAYFIVDTKRSRVFTSLGFGGIHMLAWNGFTSLESSNHISGKLILYKDLLFSINKDYSISAWNTSTGNYIFDLYFLTNGGWVLIRQDGKVFASASGKPALIKRNN